MKPRVSVVMPVHNAAKTLPITIKSMQRQHMTGFEVVAVDDGSDDESLSILKSAAAKDRRFRIIPIKKSGIIAALNTGLKDAKAPLVARMDADDVCHPGRFSLQAQYMNKHPRVKLVGSRVRLFPRADVMGGMRHYEAWVNSLITQREILRDLFVESPFAHPSVMFDKDAVLSLGGYREMGWPEDYDLWLRMAEARMAMGKLRDTLLFWRESPGRLSRAHGMYSSENFRNVKAHFLHKWRLKGVRRLQLWGAGRDGKTWAKLLIKTGFDVVQFIDIDKKKVGGQACGGIPVVWPADIIKGMPVVAAVGIKGARQQIRDYLSADGYKEPDEFMFLS